MYSIKNNHNRLNAYYDCKNGRIFQTERKKVMRSLYEEEEVKEEKQYRTLVSDNEKFDYSRSAVRYENLHESIDNEKEQDERTEYIEVENVNKNLDRQMYGVAGRVAVNSVRNNKANEETHEFDKTQEFLQSKWEQSYVRDFDGDDFDGDKVNYMYDSVAERERQTVSVDDYRETQEFLQRKMNQRAVDSFAQYRKDGMNAQFDYDDNMNKGKVSKFIRYASMGDEVAKAMMDAAQMDNNQLTVHRVEAYNNMDDMSRRFTGIAKNTETTKDDRYAKALAGEYGEAIANINSATMEDVENEFYSYSK